MKDLYSFQDERFIISMKRAVNLFINRLISRKFQANKAEFTSNTSMTLLKKLNKRTRTSIISEFYENIMKIQYTFQLFLCKLLEFKRSINATRFALSTKYIEISLERLIALSPPDSFIKAKLLYLQALNQERSSKIVTFSIENFTYEGEVEDNTAEGRGRLKFLDGSQYDGEFKDGKFDGRGVFKHSNGIIFDGEFKCGTIGDRGSSAYPDGTIYNGSF